MIGSSVRSTLFHDSFPASANRLQQHPIRPCLSPLWQGADRPGVELGPSAMLAGLQRRWLSTDQPELLRRLDCLVTLHAPSACCDGDVGRGLGHLPLIESFVAEVADFTAESITNQQLALTLGGDHAASIGSIAGAARAAAAEEKRLGVLWIDAHPDLNTPETTISGHIHGMSLAAPMGWALPAFAQAVGGGPWLDPADVCLLGIRDIDPAEQEAIDRHQIWMRTMPEWTEIGIMRGLETALDHLLARGVDTVHISWDLDVLDPAVLPGTGVPVPDGLGLEDARAVVRRLHAWDGPVRSLDLVELNPPCDPSGVSTDLAVSLLATLLGEVD